VPAAIRGEPPSSPPTPGPSQQTISKIDIKDPPLLQMGPFCHSVFASRLECVFKKPSKAVKLLLLDTRQQCASRRQALRRAHGTARYDPRQYTVLLVARV